MKIQRKYYIAILSVFWVLLSCTTAVDSGRKVILEFLKSHQDMACIYKIMHKNDVIAEGVQGFSDRETKEVMSLDQKMPIASATKTMTAALILKLQEKGMLTVHDHVIKYFDHDSDWWPNNRTPKWASEVTINDLLTHTSGLGEYIYSVRFDPEVGFDKVKKMILSFVAQAPTIGTVGEKYYYSNTNYFLLGLIIEKIMEQDLASVFKEELFDPLGMNDTSLPNFNDTIDYQRKKLKDFPTRYLAMLNKDGNGTTAYVEARPDFYVIAFSDGGVISTVSDLMKWNQALHSGKILSDFSYKLMTTAHTSEFQNGKALGGVGYGIKILELANGDKVYHHPGNAFGIRCENGYVPSSGLYFSILSNVMVIPSKSGAADDLNNVKNHLDIESFRNTIQNITNTGN